MAVFSACCNFPVDFLASLPLCVRCNGVVSNDGRRVKSRHDVGHNERCLNFDLPPDDNPAGCFEGDNDDK